jgi:hypothetical protein
VGKFGCPWADKNPSKWAFLEFSFIIKAEGLHRKPLLPSGGQGWGAAKAAKMHPLLPADRL